MSEKCAYARFLYKKCQRERTRCHVYKQILEDCNSGNLRFTGPQYKLSHNWINDTCKSRNTTYKDNRKNT